MAGGARPGSGPKPGTKNRVNKLTRKLAKQAVGAGKLLPHELLLKIAHGEVFRIRRLVIVYFKSGAQKGQEKERKWVEEDYYPSFTEQVDAAKAAAPYYAPRLATQVIKTDEQTADALTTVMKELAKKLPG